MDKNTSNDRLVRKGGRKMATQLQPTPTLYGKDAEELLKQIQKKPSQESLRKAKERSSFFAKIKKRGL